MSIRLAVLASHGGSNLQAIIDSCFADEIDAHVALVISNNSNSGALRRAENANVPFMHMSGSTHPGDELDLEMAMQMEKRSIDLIVLAGYMKKLGSKVVSTFPNRIINIHPGPLPEFGGEGMYGIKVHEAVLASGVKESGATVHIVDEEYDRGRILAFSPVPVLKNDTPDSLAARVLVAEHALYPATIGDIADGTILLS